MEAVESHRSYGPRVLGFVAITVSDSRQPENDASGDRIEALASGAGHRMIERRVVRDEIEEIQLAVQQAARQREVDVVVLSGGTGFSPRDVTLEALAPLFERSVDGFGELFRMLSYRQVQAAAMLSRAGAGVIGERLIFALPGSPRAVELAMEEIILPEAGHLLGQLRRAK
jgi:molybdenum cofactor biosynthesis protein B